MQERKKVASDQASELRQGGNAAPVPIIERAFELARTGRFETIENLKRQLSREGYESARSTITGASLLKQLQALFKSAASQRLGPSGGQPPHGRSDFL